MAATVVRRLSRSSTITFLLLSLSLTWKPTNAQLSENGNDDKLTIALGTETRTLSALGTLTRDTLPTECFSPERRSSNIAGAVTSFYAFQGCDAGRQTSCCQDGYSTGGFYYATECPVGYTPRPTDLGTAGGQGTFSVDGTEDGVAFCCPVPNQSSGLQESGFFMSDGLICDGQSIETGVLSTTIYERVLASAIVIVMTGTSLPSSTSSGGTSSRSTDGIISPAETSGSAATGGTGSGGMSNGAIIGIAVGVGFPVLAIIGFLIYKFGRGGGKKEDENGEPAVVEGGVGGMMY
ncbi:hypothetical protein TWF506_001487 [Arthrobotrys conoides]|uniref:Mid2 domain-containing protein n=1 Tax=Arthrobotrys conoides TaxID=74498 RepID=A0AAN8PRZ2_9PEZI